MAEVELDNVMKKYGSLTAVDQVSFTVEDGEFFSLLGPSGAGKTTILQMISGIEHLTSGDIYIGGERANDVNPKDRDVAMAFEDYNLYPHFTVYENMAFPLRAPTRKRKYPESEERERVEEVATILGIDQLLDRNPDHLSGGQKQRVSLGRALVRHPKVFLLDEPISHLDAKLKEAMRAEMQKIASELGTTVIYVTHDYREALGMSTKMGVLYKGKIRQIATPEEIFENPLDDVVGSLVGEFPMNLWDGEFVGEDGKVTFKNPSFQVSLPKNTSEKLKSFPTNQPPRVGVRPRHLSIHLEEPSGIQTMRGQIVALEYKPDSTLASIRVGDVIMRAATDEHLPRDLETVWISVQEDRICLLERALEKGGAE